MLVGRVSADFGDALEKRLVGSAGVLVSAALFGALLSFGAGVQMPLRSDPVTTLLMLDTPLPPPPKPPRVVPQSRRDPGRASPRNVTSKATEIVRVPAPVLPTPPIIATAPTPGVGLAASNGASDRAGAGEAAGGSGAGSGSGDAGDGDGGGVPPRQIKGKLSFDDLPPALRMPGRTRTIGVRYDVGIDGRVSNCIATRSSGDVALDELTCGLIERRFRFKPSRDEEGDPVASTIEESHSWTYERTDDD